MTTQQYIPVSLSGQKSEVIIRRADDRLHSFHGWLDSYHTFSFGRQHDPAFMGYKSLRVINEDKVAPKMGFGEHAHENMEIISYVISGQLEHKDSLGNGRIISSGEFQYMSAGSGVRHSEFNPSDSEPVHFFQIWITPNEEYATPRYAEKSIVDQKNHNGLTLILSPNGENESIPLRQDAMVHFGHLDSGNSITPVSNYTHHWLHLISGTLKIENNTMNSGDGAAIDGIQIPKMTASDDSKFILFSL